MKTEDLTAKDSRLPEGWHWEDNYEDASGCILGPDGYKGEIYFSYDRWPYHTSNGIEYQARDGSGWNIFWGNLQEFKAFAENYLLERMPEIFTQKLENVESELDR